MFCPTCGKDNPLETKFCATCGTNLEVVSQALQGSEEDFFTKMDAGIDQLLARYSEHVFRNSPQVAADRQVGGSWKLLGRSVVTSLVDILLFFLMWNLLPLRFVILLVSSPFRLLASRGDRPQLKGPAAEGYKPPELSPARKTFPDGTIPSVTETTTRNLKRKN
jgi:hypothetical protein